MPCKLPSKILQPNLASRLRKVSQMVELFVKGGIRAAQGSRAILTFVMSVVLALGGSALPARGVVIGWNVDTDTNVTGYQVQWGTDGTTFNMTADAGTN